MHKGDVCVGDIFILLKRRLESMIIDDLQRRVNNKSKKIKMLLQIPHSPLMLLNYSCYKMKKLKLNEGYLTCPKVIQLFRNTRYISF